MCKCLNGLQGIKFSFTIFLNLKEIDVLFVLLVLFEIKFSKNEF